MTKYRLGFRKQGSRQWRTAPMGSTLEEAVSKYRDWSKRPDQPQSATLSASKREPGSDTWVILSNEEFKQFQEAATVLQELASITIYM